MFKFNRLALAVVATSLTAGAFYTNAKTLTSSASVTVQNAIDFSEVSPLSFGTLTATGSTTADDSSNITAKITVFADGTESKLKEAAGNGSVLNKIVDGTPAEFAIANAGAEIELYITKPDTTTLSSSVGTAKFTVDGFSAFDVTLGRGLGDKTGDATKWAITTDENGAATFRLGASISAPGAATQIFEDGTYSGTYTVTVAY